MLLKPSGWEKVNVNACVVPVPEAGTTETTEGGTGERPVKCVRNPPKVAGLTA